MSIKKARCMRLGGCMKDIYKNINHPCICDREIVLTKGMLLKMIQDVTPKPIDFEPINQYVAAGGSMENVHLITSDIQFRDVPTILTTKGLIKIMYSQHVSENTCYLCSLPLQGNLFT